MTSIPMSSVKLVQGRSGVSGITATIFGASGFLGKYVVNKFGQIGSKCVLPYRGDEVDVRHLKLCGDLGVINPVESSIRSLSDIEDAVAGSNVVINLLGKHFETSRWSYNDIHGAFPGVLATVCAEQGVERFVHVSAMGAAHDASSTWARSKILGEESVREAFPGATIMRPATIFGDEDKFLNRIAKLSQLLPVYPMGTDAAEAKQQPVYCDDVAQAIFNAATASGNTAAGKTLDLAGPKVYTNRYIFEFVMDQIKEDSNLMLLPPSLMQATAAAMGVIPNPWMSLDMDVRRKASDVVMPPGAASFEEVGMAASDLMVMEDLADRYLLRFRKMSEFVDHENADVVSQPK